VPARVIPPFKTGLPMYVNLVTQRAKVFENATHEWVDANLGSKLTMKYPSMLFDGHRVRMAKCCHGLCRAWSDPGCWYKNGSFCPEHYQQSGIQSISKVVDGLPSEVCLRSTMAPRAQKSSVVCDALLLDPQSRSDTYPTIEIDENDVTIGHEASVSKVGEEQLFYLMRSRPLIKKKLLPW